MKFGIPYHTSEILQWLNRVLAKQPDIILLDLGGPTPIEEINKPDSMNTERTKQTLGAIAGFEVRVLSSTLDALIKQHRVVKLASGRLERYQVL
jgi:hypothetical protein